ncbi:uncharacterized protein SPSK_01370 [Sporothrix schenckii 1099-18]|uniref:Rab-GAP TBC domain-containing protein n=1 Tax=Sporothrix schenckii 1099-18 TaxID=1397361 RepID=A0A0F2MFP6_SPOSC|nr:uncharacterized protein SPSK_01370 [Sporothrix schenckii 1099-18]KJR86976.1 hypothetical protein SPSK_01370 [Sporothrix schenckii 1099-18]
MALHRFNSVGGGSHAQKPRLSPRKSASSLTSPSSTSVMSAPGSTPASTVSPLRSSHLVALRYEETVQAKPPIMVTQSRGGGGSNSGSGSATSSALYLVRSRSTLSTRSLATTATATATAAAASSPSVPLQTPSLLSSSASSASTPSPSPSPSPSKSTAPRYPLVILRPPGLIVPPSEQHPALRTPPFHPIVEEGGDASEEMAETNAATPTPYTVNSTLRSRTAGPDKGPDLCKRDSILASSAASTVSTWPEDAQDMEDEANESVDANSANSATNDTNDANDANGARDEARDAHKGHAQHAEDEDEDDNSYASCLCRSASRRSKVASVVSAACPAPVREAPLPPTDATHAPTHDDMATGDTAGAAASRVVGIEPTTTAHSARPSVDVHPGTAAAAAPAERQSTTASVTRDKSWRLSRSPFSFRGGPFQRSGRKKTKHSASEDATPAVQYEDGLIPVVDPDTTAHETLAERQCEDARGTADAPASSNPILPAFTAQSPLPLVGPAQCSAVPSTAFPALQHPHQHARLTKPNPASRPVQPQQRIAPASFPLDTTAPSSLPLPSISSFASFPTPSLPYISAIENPFASNQNNINSTTPLSPPPPLPTATAPPRFLLRVLSMSDSRQKRQHQQDQQDQDRDQDRDQDGDANRAIPKRDKDAKDKTAPKGTKRESRATATGPHDQPPRPTVSSMPLINTAIPDEHLLEDDVLQTLTFSKRGSLMFGGKRAFASSASSASFASSASSAPPPSAPSPLALPPMNLPPLAPAVERESLQVRSLYASGPGADVGAAAADAADAAKAPELEGDRGKTAAAATAAVHHNATPTRRYGRLLTAVFHRAGAPTGHAVRDSLCSSHVPSEQEREPEETAAPDKPSQGPEERPSPEPREPQGRPGDQPQDTQEPPQDVPRLGPPPQPPLPTLQDTTPPPDVSSPSVAPEPSPVPTPPPAPAPAPTDHLRPDAAARASASNNDTRTSIVSATSATTASTGIALTEGTESPLSLVPTATPHPSEPSSPYDANGSTNGTSITSPTSPASPVRNAYELAGGLEDWEDVDVADVDRFGFIHVRPPPQGTAATANGDGDADEETVHGNKENENVQRGDSLASGIGRHFSLRHRSTAARRSNHRTLDNGNGFGARSVHTSRSTSTTATAAAAARSSIRAAANQLPHNKDRRWIDEAGGMLTLEPGLADIAEDEDAERLADVLKRKEWERAEKWRRMARAVVRNDGGRGGAGAGAVGTGAGMEFVFDLHHPKLVERTWKGIPDRWRATAWYSFLASSAERRRAQRVPPLPSATPAGDASEEGEGATAPPPIMASSAVPDGGETDTQIIAAFHRLQDTASPDDVQIDLDVPRTVNGHVMFRKRYRGGQRLLFRVLHALSLYFHATGYVQGMASLAATLLCYYDEERCFVMLVRLFHLRGLERLYEPGFGGLMEALGEYEQQWLARSNRRVAQKLSSLNIDATTYATRWYLTLFNLSVPFPAQLRIWDIFMLLGDADNESLDGGSGRMSLSRPGSRASTRPGTAATTRPGTATATTRPGTATADAAARPANLAILHATSTALIDGLQDVLSDADFENAMKAVTSWVPIKDVDLLMKVVHAEWKRYQKRKARR